MRTASSATVSLTVLLVGATAVLGQVAPPAWSVGLAAGSFADYPSIFSPRSCDRGAWGGGGSVGRRLRGPLWLVASATAAIPAGEEACNFPAAPAPTDGSTFSRTAVDDAIPGVALLATHLALLVRPRERWAVRPRARLGGGRVWDKELWNWFYSVGVAWRLGAHQLVVEVERWNLPVEYRNEVLIFRDGGAHELVRADGHRETFRPYLYTVAWELAVR